MNLAPTLKHQFLDSNGTPLAGGKVYSYAASTTSPLPTYKDAAGTPNDNPIILDARGEADIWIDQNEAYKFVVMDSADGLIYSQDNVSTIGIGNVDTGQVADGAITEPKLADNAVSAQKLRSSASVDGDRAVTTNHIRNESVTLEKIDPAVFTGLPDNVTIEYENGQLRVKDGVLPASTRQAISVLTSGSSGTFSTSSTTPFQGVPVTNHSLTITSTGRPYLFMLQGGDLSLSGGSGFKTAIYSLYSDTGIVNILATINITAYIGAYYSLIPASAVAALVYLSPGTRTIMGGAKSLDSGTSLAITNCVLSAVEL